mmetsp:Transcript_1709/g.2471  ORF Transcript_1709/g.2471 Transcript_1709/m.2471 type:complete len:229 (-) Transcript_1709:148-834(-)
MTFRSHGISELQEKLPGNSPLDEKLDLLYRTNTLKKEMAIGFKWMVNQIPEGRQQLKMLSHYINANNVSVISLERDNLIRHCFSLFDARQRHLRGVSVHHEVHTSEKEIKDEIMWTITMKDWSHCMRWFDRMEKIRGELLSYIEPENILRIKYKDLCSTETEELSKLQSFLGIGEFRKSQVVHEQVKMHKSNLSRLVKNWNEVYPEMMEIYQGLPIEQWAIEAECQRA